MTTSFDPNLTAVVFDPHGPMAELEQFVERNGLTAAKRYTIHKLDDLNGAVVEGRYSSVVFPSESVAIRGIWEGDIDFPRWRERNVAIHFVARAPAGAEQQLGLMADEWGAWNAVRRRRNAIAGSILSVFLLAAAFLINYFCAVTR
jgi:hypothetical protein